MKLTNKYRRKLMAFKRDEYEATLEFPASLSSYDRMIVHDLCETLELAHESHGEDQERYIVVTKPRFSPKSRPEPEATAPVMEASDRPTLSDQTPEQPKPPPTAQQAVSDSADEEFLAEKQVQQEEKSVVKCCPCCGKHILEDNFDIHEVRCQRMKRLEQAKEREMKPAGSISATELKKKAKKQKKKGKKDPQGPLGKGPGRDAKGEQKRKEAEVEALMATMTEENRYCQFKKCRELVVTTGLICDFCKLKFCLTHSLAEAHGCQDAARRSARQGAQRDAGRIRNGFLLSAVKNPNAEQKEQARRKLQKSLQDKASQRKAKTKPKGKK